MSQDLKDNYFAAIRELFRRDAGLIPRIVLTIGSGLLLSAAALVAAWGMAWIAFSKGERRWMHVEDELLAVAFAGGTLLWFLALAYVWRGEYRAKTLLMPIILTISLGVTTVFAGVALDSLVRSEEEYLIVALVLLAGLFLLVIWLPLALRLRRRTSVLGDDDLVQVYCPSCGYSLIGLVESRCPECGAQYTIDELIRHQDYEASPRQVGRGKLRVTPGTAGDEPRRLAR